jgi:hypothetical protein
MSMWTETNPPGQVSEVVGLYEVAAHKLHLFEQFKSFPISIGRTRKNDIQLKFDASVSELHCVIEREGSDYIIYDHRSTNGVVIADVEVMRFVLRPGTQIYLGRAELYAMGPHSQIPITATTESAFLEESLRVYGSARAAEKRINVSYMTILRAARRRRARAIDTEKRGG